MKYNPAIHHRRSIRLKGYDYTQAGAYFITICTHNRECLFGEITDGRMQLNHAGIMLEHYWRAIPEHFPHVVLDAFVVMPNHIHGILYIHDTPVGANNYSPLPSAIPAGMSHGTSKTVGSVVRGFKIGVTKWIRCHTAIHDVWQRNYYEHIIRDDRALQRIRHYIANNPKQWALDRENPAYQNGQGER